MSKTLQIDSCGECPHWYDDQCTHGSAPYIHKTWSHGGTPNEIPKACPLPDSNAAQQAMLEDILEFLESKCHYHNGVATSWTTINIEKYIKELKQKHGGENGEQSGK